MARWSGELGQECKRIQLGAECFRDGCAVGAGRYRQGHDNDAPSARPRYGSEVSAAFAARREFPQVVGGTRIAIRNDA